MKVWMNSCAATVAPDPNGNGPIACAKPAHIVVCFQLPGKAQHTSPYCAECWSTAKSLIEPYLLTTYSLNSQAPKRT